MKKLHRNKEFKIFIIYNITLCIAFFTFKQYNILDKIIRYLLFQTEIISFKDLLSIGITVLAIIIGAIITAATVLMSMCNTRLMKLIKEYGKSNSIINTIKESIITGIVAVCLYAIIYANLDYAILLLRLILLYFASLLSVFFIIKSKVLIELVLSLLNGSINGDDSIVEKPKFVNPKDKNNQ